MAQRVESSAIAAIDYTAYEKTGELPITMAKGGTWIYHNVPKVVVSGLANAGSKGRFFNLAIRGSYTYTRA